MTNAPFPNKLGSRCDLQGDRARRRQSAVLTDLNAVTAREAHAIHVGAVVRVLSGRKLPMNVAGIVGRNDFLSVLCFQCCVNITYIRVQIISNRNVACANFTATNNCSQWQGPLLQSHRIHSLVPMCYVFSPTLWWNHV